MVVRARYPIQLSFITLETDRELAFLAYPTDSNRIAKQTLGIELP
jgi:hypothetical protein